MGKFFTSKSGLLIGSSIYVPLDRTLYVRLVLLDSFFLLSFGSVSPNTNTHTKASLRHLLKSLVVRGCGFEAKLAEISPQTTASNMFAYICLLKSMVKL